MTPNDASEAHPASRFLPRAEAGAPLPRQLPIKEALAKLRLRLLDLTSRNRLLNFRHSAGKTLQFVNSSPAAVFRHLMANAGPKAAITPVPEPPRAEWVRDSGRPTRPDVKQYAAQLGLATDYELSLGDNREGGALRALYYPDDLARHCRKLARDARSAIEETGANMLYLVFGFLVYPDRSDSDKLLAAPLVCVPVALEKNRVDPTTGQEGFTLRYTGEDLAENLSLREKLKQEHSLELPVFDDEPGLEAYFRLIDKKLKTKPRWAVKRQVTLTLLSFSKMLLLRDIDPAKWPSDSQGASKLLNHPIVRTVFEGAASTGSSPSPRAEDYYIDGHPAAGMPLIYDADSSQHSALIDALGGRNLVVEGPPGTGKSQTITNLIAAALAQGKSVLFVAEKLAALQVVKKRLAAANMEHLCLELHSNKTHKKLVLEEIRKRRDAGFAAPSDLPADLQSLEEKRKQLAAYAELLNSVRGNACEMTVHQVLWRAECLRRKAGDDWAVVQGIHVVDAGQVDRASYTRLYDQLSHVAEHFIRIADFGPTHPFWGLYCDEFLPGLDFRLERILKGFAPAFEAMVSVLKQSSTLLGGSELPTAAVDLATVQRALEEVTPPPLEQMANDVLPRLFPNGAEMPGRQVQAVLGRLQEKLARIAALRQDIGSRLLPTAQFDENERVEATRLSTELQHLGLLSLNCLQLKEFAHSLSVLMNDAAAASARLPMLCEQAGVPFSGEVLDLQRLLALTKGAATAPRDLLPYHYPALQHPDTLAVLQRARAEHLRLSEETAHLNQLFYLDGLDGSDGDREATLGEAISVLREGPRWHRALQSRWRDACAFHQSLERAKQKKRAAERLQELERIAALIEARRSWTGNSAYREALGPFLTDAGPDFANALHLAHWHHEARQRVVDAGLETGTAGVPSGDEVRLARLAALHPEATAAGDALNALQNFLREHFGKHTVGGTLTACVTWAQIASWAHTVEEQLQGIIATLAGWAVPAAACGEVFRAVQACVTLPEAVADLDADEPIPALIGARYQGEQTGLDPIVAAFGYGHRVLASRLSAPLVAVLLQENTAQNHQTLAHWVAELQKGWERVVEFQGQMQAIGRFDIEHWAGDKPTNPTFLASLATRTRAALTHFNRLLPWVRYLQAAQQAKGVGLTDFVALLERKEIAPEHLAEAFGYRFFASIAERLLGAEPQLAQFAGASHEQLRAEYARLDRKIIGMRGLACARSASSRLTPPQGTRSAVVGEKTDMALIDHMLAHPLARVTLRRMLQRAGRAVQALKPCFMMGPQAVAQYLEPGGLQFDIVIMDEASQLRLEEAIGAIARGKQLIVVGDPKQLPPTSFFDRLGQTAEDGNKATQTSTDDAESILDVCMGQFRPVRTLRGHYRSQHESLIAFSNSRFYDNTLNTFPSRFGKSDRLGLRYRYVPDAVYEKQINKLEAAHVVDAAIEHMVNHPDESLGIVTLNLRQRDFIEELLEARCRSCPATETFRAKWEGEGMGLLVKNLESVQGDEREVMFISTTFGPAPGTHVVRQNFGPISRQTGWRRLNVLFTRARKSVYVFSSLRPEDIVVDAGTPAGTKALREYLEFARSGTLAEVGPNGTGPESDFEVAVSKVLTEAGYQLVPQLGVGAFRMDMAVQHPSHPSAYLAAIECDGATYHKGASVRERDRIRQQILESLGWNGRIWRIWSADWFRSPRRETQRMLDFLESLKTKPIPASYAGDTVAEVRAPQELTRPSAPEPVGDMYQQALPGFLELEQTLPAEYGLGSTSEQAGEGVVVEVDGDEDLDVEVGDTVTYAPLGRVDQSITAQIVPGDADEDGGRIAETSSVAQMLLSALVNDQVVLRVPGKEPQRFVVQKIVRSAAGRR